MEQILSFPGLGIEEFTMNRVAFTLFGHGIYWYGIIIAVAFLLAIVYIIKRASDFGIDDDKVLDVLICAVVGGIVGARLYYVVFSWADYKDNLIDVFKIWEGGIAIYGGIIGGTISAWIMCRVKKLRFIPTADLTAGGLILGQAIGRWGNFVNIEAFGSNTTLPWGMTSPTITNYLFSHQSELAAQGINVDPLMPVHPTFFYESLWCLVGFLLLVWYTKRRKFDGEIALIYLGWYGFGRMIIEGLRTDSLMLGDMRVSQVLAMLLVLASALILLYKRSIGADELYVNTDESHEELALAANRISSKNKKNSEHATQNVAKVMENSQEENTDAGKTD